MSTRIFIPRESTARALGADRVAAALVAGAAQRGLQVTIIRTGSRGAFFLEPLVEVEVAGRRIAYGPVAPGDVAALLDAGLVAGAAHPLRLGEVDAIPWLASQQRMTCTRLGVIDPTSLADYLAHGGYAGLRAALDQPPHAIVQAIIDSGLRGRGGAAFPAGTKWRTVAGAPGARKYVVCNADEGDSGTFADRLLMEGDPFCLLEGMAIAGIATGATRGMIYLRLEYPQARAVLEHALAAARTAGYLGASLCGTGHCFDIELRIGAGAYICGEETALLESLEGRRGQVRAKPPLPAHRGLFGCPTLVNNVMTLAAVPSIIAQGAAAHAAHGSGRSRGTLTVQLAGNVARGGLIECDFGLPLRTVLGQYGGGTRSGRPVRAVQVGGPLGAWWPESLFDTPLDYESFTQAGGMLGHGGIVVFDDTIDLAEQARHAMAFCAHESCGKCTPCRIGSTRGVEVIDRLRSGDRPAFQRELLLDLCHTMELGSLCALGGLTPLPVRSALEHFAGDFA